MYKLLIVAGFLAISPISADQAAITPHMPASQVKSLLTIASQLSGYSIPADVPLPIIQEVSAAQMALEACGSDDPLTVMACPVVGSTDEDGNIEVNFEALIRPGVSKSLNAVTVHELVHWLQVMHHKASGSRTYCPDRFLVEYEAYEAESKYQVIYEGKEQPDGVMVAPTFCPTPPGSV